VKRALVLTFSVLSISVVLAFGQPNPASGRTLVVIPFDNTSPTPGLDWVSDAFPVVLREQLSSPLLYVASREDLVRAYDRQGIPVGLHPSRATLYRLAEQMDVDYAVLGSYRYNGAVLTGTAQLLDMRSQKLLPAAIESGALTDLGAVQSALAWNLLRSIRPGFSMTKAQYFATRAPIRLDALEHFVRGETSSTLDQKEEHYKEAVRLNSSYEEAWLELGKTYFAERSYESAIGAFSHVSSASPMAREANFFLGLAAYEHGDLARAETAFEFVAARLPLAEVYNNLGVVAARRGHKTSVEYFEKAIRNDPSNPDYHFNLGVVLNQSGDSAGANRELRAALERRPNDVEAKALLDSLPASPVVRASSVTKLPVQRMKLTYEEDTFRQMTAQMQGWVEERFARSDTHSHAQFHVERGKELLARGFAAEAEDEFRHAATVDPSSTTPLLGLVDVALARGDKREARAQAEAALRLHESADAYMVLARLDLSENRVEAAADNLKQASRVDPRNIEVQNLKRVVAAKLAEKAPKP
jgi:tetratricopeptide (TPR) repeat protein